MDATKVIPALLTCLKFNCIVGKVAPNYILAINKVTLSCIDSAIDLATEVKAVVLMIHNCPEQFTPIKLLCIHPQTTNESAHTFNDHIYVSDCMDGVSHESGFQKFKYHFLMNKQMK